MIKILSFLFFLIFLTQCAAPGTALLSPVITGAKTKSAHQASLSLASSLTSKQFIKDNKRELNELKKSVLNKGKKILNNEN
tara:strand:- start:1929 stop:2171 length:243 start_codon:yes stop_codon:yes gene_type:complete